MKKTFSTVISTISLFGLFSAFTSCNTDTSNPATNPATKIEITAQNGTDFGTLKKGESSTKKFTVTLDGYADRKLDIGMPYGFESPDFDSNSLNSFNKKTASFDFTAVYSPLFDGSDDDNTIRVVQTGFGGFSGEITVHAEGENTGLKNPYDNSAKTIVSLIDKPETVSISERDESGIRPRYTVTAKEGSVCKIKVRYTSDKYEISSSTGTLSGSPFTYNYKNIRFPNEADKNYIEIEISFDGNKLANLNGIRYLANESPVSITFGKATVYFITQE